MPPEDKEKLNTIDKLKNKIFSNSYKTKIEYRDDLVHKKKTDIASAWIKKAEIPKRIGKFFMKTSVFQKFFIFSVIFFVLAIGYVAYMFLWGSNTVSNENIDIAVFGNTFVAGGEELSLQIQITNKNNSALELVDLVMEYPRGSGGGSSQDIERIRETIGSIPAGGVHDENLQVVLFGEQGSVRPIKISLEYRIEGSNSIFVKEKQFNVSINSTPINILIDAPTSVVPNQEITFNVKTTLNATKKSPGILLKLDYPPGFEFTSSSPEPSLGNNIWDLGVLDPGKENDISIVGKMVDVFDGEEKTFHVSAGTQSKKDKSILDVVFNSLAHTVLVQKPFVEARLFVNGIYQREYSANSKGLIRGEVRWENNLNTKVNDLSIRVKLSGNALNRKTINPEQGFYNSSIDEIVWDKNSRSQFREIQPGEFGAVAFTLFPLTLYSASDGMLIEPIINLEVSVSGKQALEGNVLKEVDSSETKIVRIVSDVGLYSQALYYSGQFTNKGPIPPTVEKETTYTIVWSITNTANNLSKTEVRSTLPPWINFTGVTSPAGEDVIYSSTTKEVLWNAGNVKKGAGITEPDKKVSFQVSFTPSLSQVETTPFLLNEAVLTGHDDFSNASVRSNARELTTRLSNDPLFSESGAKVVE